MWMPDYYLGRQKRNPQKKQNIHKKEKIYLCDLKWKILGELKHFKRLEVEHTKEDLFLFQQNYTRDILKIFGMLECNPISTPVEPNVKIYELDDRIMYRKLLGRLTNLHLYRFNITDTIKVFIRFMQRVWSSIILMFLDES